MIVWELFWRFLVLSLLAFGGGAGIALIERTAVNETAWVDAREFTAAIALAQVTPGPVMIAATFIGYRAGGLAGAIAATLGAFLVPTVAAAVLARQVGKVRLPRRWHGFRRGASAAAIGLLGVTVLSLGRHAIGGWADASIVGAAVVVSLRTKIHPFWVLVGGGVLGAAVDGLRGVSLVG
jgi:chromate transporter